MVDISDPKWSEQDPANNGAAPDGVQGGYAPNTIAPILRATRGGVKRAYNKINAIYTTTGNATALVLTLAATPDAIVKGERYAFFSSHTNTGAMTLNVNGLGAKSILQQDGAALKAGQVVAGTATAVIYDGTNFRLENYISNPKFSGTLTVDAFSTTGTMSAGDTSVLSLTSSGSITSPLVTVSGAAGTDRLVGWKTADKQRWAAFTNASAESGANAGSDFAVARYADNGDYIDAPLSINRKEGTVYVEKGLVVKDTVYVGSAGAALYADGNLKFVGNMASNQGAMYLSDALNAKLNKSGGTMTGTLGLPSVSDSSFRQGNADGASYTGHNLIMKGWWGMGMSTYDNSVNGYYDFRLGKWDTKGGTFRNGTEYVLPNGQMHNLSINLSAGQLRDAGSPTGQAMTFNWNGQAGQPEWMWGGNDGKNMYVYRPSELTVKNSAQLGGVPASDYLKVPVRRAPETPSGSIHYFGNIPAGVQSITIRIAGLTVSGGNWPILRLGNSVGFKDSGYESRVVGFQGNALNTVATNAYFALSEANTNGANIFATVRLSRHTPGSNMWLLSGESTRNTSGMNTFTGAVVLDSELTSLALFSTPNAGSVLAGTNSLSIEYSF